VHEIGSGACPFVCFCVSSDVYEFYIDSHLGINSYHLYFRSFSPSSNLGRAMALGQEHVRSCNWKVIVKYAFASDWYNISLVLFIHLALEQVVTQLLNWQI
jgi:hypothetical protein